MLVFEVGESGGRGTGRTMGVGRWDTCILEVVAHRRHRERSFWWKYLIEARDVILKMWSGLNWTVCLGRSDIGRCSFSNEET